MSGALGRPLPAGVQLRRVDNAPGVTAQQQLRLRLSVGRGLRSPMTVPLADAPHTGPGKRTFEVAFLRKDARTALGWSEQPGGPYLTPEYAGRGGYVSLGGAGFCYPASQATGSSYGEGDRVRAELCLDSKRVAFFVNGKAAGSAAWMGPPAAYPAISTFPGELECEITLDVLP